MKQRALLVAAAALLLVLSAAPASADEVENSLREGAWAIQFGIDDNFTLSDFAGQVGLKYHHSSRTAARIGVDAWAGGSEEDDGSFDAETESDRYGFELDFLILRYFDPEAPVNVYFGGGPLVYYDTQNSTRTVYGDSVTVETETDTDTWSAGARVTLGAEWFPTRAIGLHAEYRTALIWTSRDNTGELRRDGDRIDSYDHTTTSWGGNVGSVLFGLSAYF